jgi:ABC-type nitrate/sulfonate/bicarbonate transport system substrate-binding protein
VKLMLFRAAYNLPVTLGIERGVFARRGLELAIAYTRGSQMTVQALLSGEREVGVLSADDVVYEVERRNADLFIFMGLNAGILALVARPGIAAARELAGGRLGVDDPASGFALVAHRIMRGLGFSKNDYRTVASGGHEPRARSLAAGEIDVALLTPPFSLELAARGARVLARACDHLPRYQGSCVVATRRWAREHRAELDAYGSAYRESLAWVLDPANRSASIAHLAREFSLSPAIAAATYEALVDPADGLSHDGAVDLQGIAAVLELRLEAGLLKEPLPSPSKYLLGL